MRIMRRCDAGVPAPYLRQLPLAAPTPVLPAAPFAGQVQVFVVLKNLSASSPPATPASQRAGRRLLQAAPTDQLLFSVLLVPRPTGSGLLSRPPTDASALFVNGVAPSGNVVIYDYGRVSANTSISGGTGGVSLAVARDVRHYWSAVYLGSPQFPSGDATPSEVVNPDGTLQAAEQPQIQSAPASGPVQQPSEPIPPTAGTDTSSQPSSTPPQPQAPTPGLHAAQKLVPMSQPFAAPAPLQQPVETPGPSPQAR